MGLTRVGPGDDHREATVTLGERGRVALREGAPLWDEGAAPDRGDAGRGGGADAAARAARRSVSFFALAVWPHQRGPTNVYAEKGDA